MPRIACTALMLLAATPSIAQTLQPRLGEPVDGLTDRQNAFFIEGRQEFRRLMSMNPGLGPGFNNSSCVGCHNGPTTGGSSQIIVTRVGRLDEDGYSDLVEFGGPVLQELGLPEQCNDSFPIQANAVSSRRTPALFGLGLVEAVDDRTFIDLADAQRGAVSGRVNMGFAIEDGPDGEPRVGRFGFKAAVPTLTHFSADATLNEMGLTNRFFPNDNAPSGDPELLLFCDDAPDPEMTPDDNGRDFVDKITVYQRLLAAPPQTPRHGMRGEELFVQVGCAECHVPELRTGDGPGLEAALRDRAIKPYSDFLLHDMGENGEGLLQEGIAAGEEMRTTPLWGIRWRVSLWHDGRSGGNSLEERLLAPGYGAIDSHNVPGSEAAPSAQAFRDLSEQDQLAVVRFLDSLGRAEFDFNGDNDIDNGDIESFRDCFTGPGEFYTPDDPCAVHDIDLDGDVDSDDLAGFILALDVPQPDCDGDGVGDFDDILAGGDTNGDLIPDVCQGLPGCPGDCDGNGLVDFDDLLCTLVLFGGDAMADPADCDGDGVVSFADLVCALARFGPCESR